jgi:trimeric autotransporter adhesin
LGCEEEQAPNPTMTADIEALRARVDALESALEKVNGADDALATQSRTLEQRVAKLWEWSGGYDLRIAQLESERNGVAARLTVVETLAASVDSVVQKHSAEMYKLAPLSLEVIQGAPALVVRGVNLHLQNGLGTTSSSNGVGNIIVGYNTASNTREYVRTGSHNLVLGDLHEYGSYGAIVFGHSNKAMGAFAMAGGSYNQVTATHGMVLGGTQNLASAVGATVTGGSGNQARGEYSTVSGGRENTAVGTRSTVSGGYGRAAPNFYDWVGGSLVQDQ